MKDNKKSEKPPFEVRWESFRKAYFEWARYNPYKEDPYPKRKEIGKTEIAKLPKPRNTVEYMYLSATASDICDNLYWQALKKRKLRVKAKKKKLRKNLKQVFLDLF